MKKTLTLSILLASTIAQNSLAVDLTKKDKAVKLETVTVVATRTERDVQEVPGMVTVVDASAPSKATSAKASDLLEGVPGVEFAGGPLRSGETPNIRGFDANSIIVTLDGRKQNFESQHSSKFFIDPSLVKKVEVVKGPSSALYGSGGLGGVIAFETKDAKDFVEPGRDSGMQFSLGGQSANTEFSQVLTGFKLGENYDTIASVVHRDSHDIDLNNDTTQRSDDSLTSGYGKVTYDIDQDKKIRFDLNSFYNNAKENANSQTIVASSGTNLVDKDIYSHQAGVKYFYTPDNDLIDFSTQLYYVVTAIDEKVVQATTLTANGDDLKRELDTVGFNADNKSVVEIAGLDENIFSYGVEVYYNTQDGSDTDSGNNSGVTGGRAGVPDAASLVTGTYVQDEISFDLDNGMELLITPALRFDYYNNEPDAASLPSDTENRLSPKIASNLKLTKNYNIFGSYAEAFRAPNLTELYAQGTHFPVFGSYNNVFTPNPYLKPETSRTFEFGAGAEFNDLYKKDDELRIKASRYITKASDYIEQVVSGITIGIPPCNFPFVDASCSGGTAGWVNVPSANIWGYEFESAYDNDLIEAKLGASFVAGENANTGVALTTKQPLIVTSSLGYKFDSIDSIIGYTGKYVDDNKRGLVDTANFINYKRPGFATHGVYWTYQPKKYKDLSLNFAVDNIFDKKYRQPFSEIYDLERNYQVKVTYKW